VRVPIFELDQQSLIPFRRQAITAGVYEAEIESLLWDNLEEITGDNLFRVARQATLPSGGRPDVIALDVTGRVVVIEVKRDVDRNQLAQSLEYAGWARNTSLDELAGIYYGGAAGFWDDWKEFTGSDTPVLVQGNPRLVLVARSFDGRTFHALEFLLQHRLPVQVLKVAFYIDDTDRRFLNVEWESEPEAAPRAVATVSPPDGADIVGEVPEVEKADFRQVSLADVLPLIDTPAALVWRRPRKGQRFEATLLESGRIRLADGREFRTPSAAAMAAADVVSYDGWYAWRLGEDGPSLNDFRHRVADASTAQANVEIEPAEATSDSEGL
jgi:hypothetical protein